MESSGSWRVIEQGNPAQIANALAAVARVAVMRGEAERAARLLNAVAGLRREQGIPALEDDDADEERRTEALIRETLATRTTAHAGAETGARSLAEAMRLTRERLGANATPRVQ